MAGGGIGSRRLQSASRSLANYGWQALSHGQHPERRTASGRLDGRESKRCRRNHRGAQKPSPTSRGQRIAIQQRSGRCGDQEWPEPMRHSPKEMKDFIVAARVSVESALDSSLSIPESQSPAAADLASVGSRSLAAALLNGKSLRQAGRTVQMDRPVAKRVFLQIAEACAARHMALGRSVPPTHVRHTLARAFWAKAREHGDKRDDHGPKTVWTHLLIDQHTGAVPVWCSGPNVSSVVRGLGHSVPDTWPLADPVLPVASLDEPHQVQVDSITSLGLPRPWFDELDSGMRRKVSLHAAAVSFWVTAYNFCCTTDGSTPAMRIGWTDSRWEPSQLDELISGQNQRKSRHS